MSKEKILVILSQPTVTWVLTLLFAKGNRAHAGLFLQSCWLTWGAAVLPDPGTIVWGL